MNKLHIYMRFFYQSILLENIKIRNILYRLYFIEIEIVQNCCKSV